MTGTVERPAVVTEQGPRDLSALFAPRGVAVIGASRDPAKLGSAMSRSLAGIPGGVVGVNPRDTDPGARRYASVHDAVEATGEPIDLAVLCVPAAVSSAAIEEAGAAGVRAALVCAGGFAETGDHGLRLQLDLLSAARAAGVSVLGPNTSGFVLPRLGLTASFVPGVATLGAGPVGVVAASGGINHALAFQFDRAGRGVSLAVGIGNAVDVTAADVLHHLADDPATTVVALHVESVADGPALVAAVRAVSARKPVVALVVGRNEIGEFARSHTGALATSWRTTRAVLAAAGAVLVADERELVDAVTALSFGRMPAGSNVGVGVVTAQAGPGLLHTDGLRGAGVEVPTLGAATVEKLADLLPPLTFQRNPVDTGRPGATFADVLRAVASDAVIGVTSVYALTEPDVVDLPAAVAAAGPGPFVVGLDGPDQDVRWQRDQLHELGVAALSGSTALTNAVRAVVADAWAQAHRRPGAIRVAEPLRLDAAPDEDQAKTVLDGLSIATPQRRVCIDRAEAHRALAELPGPLAVKILDAAVLHKTDIDGVHLGVRSATDLDDALHALGRIGARRVLVESMSASGVDLIVGATRDRVFGPQVLVGLGGTVAEALGDVAVAPAPLGADTAAALLDQLAGRAVLDGYRGGPVVDRARIGEVVAALGDLLAASPAVEAIEINPLRITHDSVVALDAVITLVLTPSDGPDAGGSS